MANCKNWGTHLIVGIYNISRTCNGILDRILENVIEARNRLFIGYMAERFCWKYSVDKVNGGRSGVYRGRAL